MALPTALGTGLARLVVLTPFVASLLAHAAGLRPSPAPATLRPSLAFDQYMVDLGTIRPTDQASAWFRYRNLGHEPITLKEPEASCGCLKPILKVKSLKPGEAADLQVRVRTANVESGRKEYTITLPYVDSKPRVARLVFRVTLPEKQVLVRPKALTFYQQSGQSSEQIIHVLDQRSRPLSILSVESTSPLAKVERLDPTASEDGQPVQRIKVTVSGDLPPGRQQGLIHIRTTDSEFSALTVPLRIEGISQHVERPASPTR